MTVGLDEGVLGPDNRQYWSGHSEVEAQADHHVRSKDWFVNWGKRKQTGSGRGSPRARARIALSCAALLGRRRRGESLLRHRMSARALRMPARGVVADVTQNERIGRQRRELFPESEYVKFRHGRPGMLGVGATNRPSRDRTRSGSSWGVSCRTYGQCTGRAPRAGRFFALRFRTDSGATRKPALRR